MSLKVHYHHHRHLLSLDVSDFDTTTCAVFGKQPTYSNKLLVKTPRTRTRTRSIIVFASSPDSSSRIRLKNEDYYDNDNDNDGLVLSLYDAARVIELSIKGKGKDKASLWEMPWFSAFWPGLNKNAWANSLSYQASVYALLQAALEVASRGGGDKEVNAVVQKSLLRLSAPLESIIREKLSGKQPQVLEWFWSEQIPIVVTNFVTHFERDPRFKTATMIGEKMPFGSRNAGDMSLLVLALACSSVITKLGSAKVYCPQLFSMIPDVTGSLMDVLIGLVPIHEAYHAAKEIALHREFLVHFGPRAAACGVNDDCVADEIIFWVDVVQKQLQRAIGREKIWSKITTSESIEVLERDLAIFGFFIALGRSTQSFQAANGNDKTDEPVEGFIRYFISGCVLYYPQLSSISSYELYVEVVCEELDWLHFYPGYSNTFKLTHAHENNSESSLDFEAVKKALGVCSRWTQIFIEHSKWVENPSNVKAAQFLSRGLHTLGSSMGELGLLTSKPNNSIQSAESMSSFNSSKEPDSFDKVLENVEEALVKLEKLLQEMHVSSSGSGKEQLKAACSDLEKIRKLKKEAEFLEASFRAKAECLQEGTFDGELIANNERSKLSEGKDRGQDVVNLEKNSDPRGLWAFLVRSPTKKSSSNSSKAANVPDDSSFGLSIMSSTESGKPDSSEFRRFELLKNEVMELEKRVQRSVNQSENKEDIERANVVRGSELVPVQKNGSLIEKSIQKLKQTSTDIWQGTQLLAIDTAAATGLFRRAIIGDELSDKEKKFLRRNITDLASVIPIGVLMLLPVTAVGHAAILAAIQRYAPSLIPSTYGSERLSLLRQLERMKQTKIIDPTLEDNAED